MDVEVRITDQDMFEEFLEILLFAYKNTDREIQEQIYERIDNLIGDEFFLDDFAVEIGKKTRHSKLWETINDLGKQVQSSATQAGEAMERLAKAK